jgi:hypothetical protein
MTPTTSGGGPRPRRGGLLAAALLSGVALGALGVPALTPRADAAPPPVPASCAAFVARYFGSTTKAGDTAPFSLVTDVTGRRATYAEPGTALTLAKASSGLMTWQTLAATGTRYFSDRRVTVTNSGDLFPTSYPFDRTKTESLEVKISHVTYGAESLSVTLTAPGNLTTEYVPQGCAGFDVLYATAVPASGSVGVGGNVLVISVGSLTTPPPVPDPK